MTINGTPFCRLPGVNREMFMEEVVDWAWRDQEACLIGWILKWEEQPEPLGSLEAHSGANVSSVA